MNIAIIGVGGVGGYFGSKIALAKRKEDNIYFIARGEHLNKIRTNGLVVKSKTEGETVCHPTLATNDIGELPILDICLICVKGYDLVNVLEQLKEKIKDDTQIIPLLNGIDIYDKVRQVIKDGYVYPACVYIGTHIEKPGVISQNGGQCRIIFGRDIKRPESDAKEVREYFTKVGIDFCWSTSYREAIWNKFMCVGPYSLVTAAYDKTMREVYDDKVLSEKVLKIMDVVYQLAKLNQVNLEEDAVKNAYEKAKEFPYDTKTSFHRDHEKQRSQDERETFGGAVLEMAKHFGIDASVVQEVYDLL